MKKYIDTILDAAVDALITFLDVFKSKQVKFSIPEECMQPGLMFSMNATIYVLVRRMHDDECDDFYYWGTDQWWVCIADGSYINLTETTIRKFGNVICKADELT